MNTQGAPERPLGLQIQYEWSAAALLFVFRATILFLS